MRKMVTVIRTILLFVGVLVSVMISTAAAELPKLLPESAAMFGTSGVTVLETLAGSSIDCVSNRASATPETEGRLGKFTIDLEKCGFTVAGVKVVCTGLSEATGIVLVSGTFHLVYDVLGTGTGLGVGILFLLAPEVHLECPAGGTLILVKGSVVCLVKPVTTKVKATEHYSVACEHSSPGDSREIYFNDAGATIKTTLLTSFAGGTFEGTAETSEATLKSTVETEIMG